ncbi:hypothetical protein H1B27_31055 [Bradyrhizobium sp. CNPSo 4019]|uniref:Aspartate/glutamate racemase family protein n=2 Tax=Bradyrhizobium diversitatis TaxID=2755406 RepID=A0ABS0PCC9_9BRAD|nr:hypothetical protein [Bradyrhizobium diversitatis]
MTSSSKPALGILALEKGLPAGSPAANPRFTELLDLPVISETIEGGWSELVVRGDPILEPAFVAAARKLVARGAVAISSNCGFSIRHQKAVAAAVDVPVALSSLLLLPMMLSQVPRDGKVAVVTADSSNLTEDTLVIGNPSDRSRVVIGGIEGGELLRNEMVRPPVFTPVFSIQSDVEACISRLRAAHPAIKAILFECAGFPLVSRELRKNTRLPIYDIADLCRMVFASVT